MDRVIEELQSDSTDLSLLEHIRPIGWDNVLLYEQITIPLDRSLIRTSWRAISQHFASYPKSAPSWLELNNFLAEGVTPLKIFCLLPIFHYSSDDGIVESRSASP